MTQQERWLYLPMDVRVRELHAKTLFAAAAVARGYKVVIGRKQEVHVGMSIHPPGFYLGLGAQQNFYEQFKNLRARNFVVSSMDEEGLITLDDTIYQRLKISPETLSQTDIMFAWGDHQKKILAQEAGAACQLEGVGNLRLDTLRSQYRGIWARDIAALKQKYGRYVLIVSSFGSANHFEGDKYFESLKEKKIIRSAADEQILRSYIELKKKNLQAYLEAIPALAARYPEINFIVRPHPSESHELWMKGAAGLKNVFMVSENSIQPWILGSVAIIHHFCTSSVEAMLGDVPALAYRPFADTNIETELPYRCSKQVTSLAQLQDAVGQILKGDRADIDALRAAAKDFYAGYIPVEDHLTAVQKMLDVYDQHVVKPLPLVQKIKRSLIGIIKRYRRYSWNSSYLNHKFAALSESELDEILETVAPMVGLKGYTISQTMDNCFVVSRK